MLWNSILWKKYKRKKIYDNERRYKTFIVSFLFLLNFKLKSQKKVFSRMMAYHTHTRRVVP